MKGFLAVGIVALATLTCSAKSIDWSGKGDLSRPFRDPANFKGDQLPEPGDWLYCYRGTPDIHIGDEDAALAASLGFIYQGGADIYWETTTNCTIRFRMSGVGGMFYKMGRGTTLAVDPSPYENQFDFSGYYTVAEGSMQLQDYVGRTRPASLFVVGSCTVSNDATLVVCDYSTETTSDFYRLLCYGTLTNKNPSVKHLVTFRADSSIANPSVIAGPVAPLLNLRGCGSFDILITNATYSVFNPRSGQRAEPTVIGIRSFGTTTNACSSIGAEKQLRSEIPNVTFRYLGTGERTDKELRYGHNVRYPTKSFDDLPALDGGPTGGLVMDGPWYVWTASNLADYYGYFQSLRLTGTNAVPCEWNGTFSGTSYGGAYYGTHIVKDGSGIWRFNRCYKRSWGYDEGLACAFSIEDGTLQFDSLGEVGENCALGTAGHLYDKYYGPVSGATPVPWAYSFGRTNGLGVASSEGTLEHVGDDWAFASRRLSVLLGHGRLKSSGAKSLTLRGFTARVPGEHTLTLDGANALSNAVAEVADGRADAHVSVAKEGPGLWVLKGNQTFSGDLTVREGTLVVEANTNRFDWFRFTSRQITGGSYSSPGQIAVYDRDGVRQNLGLWYPTNITATTTTPLGHECCELNPKECLYGCFSYASYMNTWSGMPMFFYGNTSNRGDARAETLSVNPSELTPFNWVPIVFRLDAGKNECVSFDVSQGNRTDGNRHVTSYLLEGSQDGVTWWPLRDAPAGSFELPGVEKWYSNGEDFASGQVRKLSDGKGYAIAGHPEVSSLPNVRYVSVAKGATLKTDYENVGTISKLRFPTAGGGTISGFKFAETGTIDIEGEVQKGKELKIPYELGDGETAANVADWGFTINGEASTKFDLVAGPHGCTLKPHGLLLLVR